MPDPRRLLPCLCLALAVTFTAARAPRVTHAQPRPAGESAVAVAERTLACVRAPHAEIAQWIRLLGEAKATLESRSASEAARRDAQESIVVLEGRLRASASALAACAEAPATTTSTSTPTAARGPARAEAEHVAEPLSVHVRAETARVIDGRGHIDAADVHAALLRLGSGLDACYEALTERRALERGSAHFVFGLAGREVRSPTLEGLAIGDAAFSQCVSRSLRTIRLARGASGGDARVDVVLHIGPE